MVGHRRDPVRRFRGKALKLQSTSSFVVRLLSVAAIVPAFMLLYGYFADDYFFHLSSWMGIVQDWHSGIAYPSWLAGANFGLGEPRFLFYPPLSLLVGALLTLALPLRIVPALYLFLITVGAGLAMRRLARFVVPQHAEAAALLYCSSYYLIANGVLRYAIAEALVAALLPLIVLWFLRAMTEEGSVVRPVLSVLLALAWLTNLPAALVCFYMLLFAAAIYAALRRSATPLIRYAVAQVIAVGLSAWYLLPAVLAKKQVAAAGIQGKFPWRAYTLFQHPHNPLARTMTYPLWLWVLGGVAVLAIWTIRERASVQESSPKKRALWLVGLLGCLPILFAVPQSGLLWNHLPEIQLVAFSWRFLPFLCVGLSIAVPVIACRPLPRYAVYALWIVLMSLPMVERVAHRRAHGGPPSLASSVDEVHAGFEGFEEYAPDGLTTMPKRGDFEGKVLFPGVQACTVKAQTWAPQRKEFVSSSVGECRYILNLFYFPEWHATMDGGQPLTLSSTTDHRAQVLLPPGDHEVRVEFVRPVAPTLLGLGVTALLVLFLLSEHRRTTRHAQGQTTA